MGVAFSASALQVEDLYKQFGSVEVLKGINLDARVGDVISMLGASGSGKSTFLRCINLLDTPDSGTVSVHGEMIRMTRGNYGQPVPEVLWPLPGFTGTDILIL